MDDERNAHSIIIEYDDGSSRVITRGVVLEIEETGEKQIINANMVGIAGRDLASIVMAMIELGDRLGLFKEGP